MFALIQIPKTIVSFLEKKRLVTTNEPLVSNFSTTIVFENYFENYFVNKSEF